MNIARNERSSNIRLAIDGGQVELTGQIPPWPHYDSDEIEAAVEVLRSGRVNYWTGNLCREFETTFARYVGMPFGVAVANGTLALELALRALGVGPGDDVVTTPRSFFATVTSILSIGARPVFADLDRDSGNITSRSVEAALTPRTRAIMAVHLGGWPCDMPSLRSLAEQRGLYLIEDCAQAHGAVVGGQMVGAWGDAAAFSFCQDKIITTGGEGGLLLLRDEAAWERAWSYKDHGKSYDAVHHKAHGPGYRWVHETMGSNWRMTEVQAAIGLRQLRKLPRWLRARRKNANHMLAHFDSIGGLRVPRPGKGTFAAYYRVYMYVRPEALTLGWNRDRIMAAIAAEGIYCHIGSCPEMYLEAAARDRGLVPEERLPVAKELGETSLCFLCHPTLDMDTVEATCRAVEKVLAAATRGG